MSYASSYTSQLYLLHRNLLLICCSAGWKNLEELLPLAEDLANYTAIYLHRIKLFALVAQHKTLAYSGMSSDSLVDRITTHRHDIKGSASRHYSARNLSGAKAQFYVAATYSDASEAFQQAESFIIAGCGLFKPRLFLKLSSRILLPIFSSRWESTFGLGWNTHPVLTNSIGDSSPVTRGERSKFRFLRTVIDLVTIPRPRVRRESHMENSSEAS